MLSFLCKLSAVINPALTLALAQEAISQAILPGKLNHLERHYDSSVTDTYFGHSELMLRSKARLWLRIDASTLRFTDDDAAVIVLSNNQGGGAGAMAMALAGTLFGETVTLPGEQKYMRVDSTRGSSNGSRSSKPPSSEMGSRPPGRPASWHNRRRPQSQYDRDRAASIVAIRSTFARREPTVLPAGFACPRP